MNAAIVQKIAWSVSDRRPKFIRKKPRISSYMLTIDKQTLTHPHFRKILILILIHLLKSHFQRGMELRDGKRNRLLSLPFPLLPQCYIDQDTVIQYVFTAARES